MGTLFGITLYARTVSEAKEAFRRAYARAAALNLMLSDYLPDSEVSRISTTPARVSPELYTVLTFARKLSEATDGAFDVTVGPLTRLWRARKPLTPEALALVGWRELYLEKGSVWVGKAGMKLDLGAIGKGFAADEILKEVGKLGIDRVLVAASGDVVCGDAPPGAKGWVVKAGEQRLTLRRAAVSTSGDTTQFYVQDGQRFSHILDPRAGRALTTLLEVSVVGPNGITADALSTAVRVLGLDQSRQICERYRARVVNPPKRGQ